MTSRPDPSKYPTLEFEQQLWNGGLGRLAGIDEAGRGAWAGPVAAGAVVLPPDPSLLETLSGVRDSKLMTPLARQSWAPRIREAALGWGVGFASAEEIDALGILPATKLAALRALAGLRPDYLLTDFLVFRDLDLPQTALVKGDRRSLSVAAASVLAKTARDALMVELDGTYPGYGFARHKGYGTSIHQEAIRCRGMCDIHRRSFAIP
ncbi:MAG TPA: ribonuclease HII [Anaerolineales bacterium]|nr:ribonuclease HII [Anaerolineales bacterium]